MHGYPDIQDFNAFREKQDIGKFQNYRRVQEKHVYQTDRQTNKQTTDRQQTNRHTNTQTNRQTHNRQTDRPTPKDSQKAKTVWKLIFWVMNSCAFAWFQNLRKVLHASDTTPWQHICSMPLCTRMLPKLRFSQNFWINLPWLMLGVQIWEKKPDLSYESICFELESRKHKKIKKINRNPIMFGQPRIIYFALFGNFLEGLRDTRALQIQPPCWPRTHFHDFSSSTEILIFDRFWEPTWPSKP